MPSVNAFASRPQSPPCAPPTCAENGDSPGTDRPAAAELQRVQQQVNEYALDVLRLKAVQARRQDPSVGRAILVPSFGNLFQVTTTALVLAKVGGADFNRCFAAGMAGVCSVRIGLYVAFQHVWTAEVDREIAALQRQVVVGARALRFDPTDHVDPATLALL